MTLPVRALGSPTLQAPKGKDDGAVGIGTETTEPNELLWCDLLRAGRDDDGASTQAHLDAGFPIYHAED